MAEMNDSPCSSDHDEYLDPLEIADSAGARLSTPERAGICRQRKVQTNPEQKRRETCAVQSIEIYPRGIKLRSTKTSVAVSNCGA
ncbi:hypothetical protein P5673_028657 [Acropora cervicornis]|uniref:Uncharacterized protein n=1 Tax=Acropora cervicornis TaxID=6130 RepID=A0AAD9UUN2_ACRCE|nr:hypothetical protein P5673_028657 [Acropora cervicornis]